ncbi:uncharacterized protein LOC115093320 [Rhinatrema bivittatum]|uniref:uncharacterized protein LOC115093320 n=1 Tax=Rhinatrema bivittatum TaxID=194408 RepID=UPI001128BA71|nr:uncharacterized protein LOC115093320 [Rhinatrema bivittatum]
MSKSRMFFPNQEERTNSESSLNADQQQPENQESNSENAQENGLKAEKDEQQLSKSPMVFPNQEERTNSESSLNADEKVMQQPENEEANFEHEEETILVNQEEDNLLASFLLTRHHSRNHIIIVCMLIALLTSLFILLCCFFIDNAATRNNIFLRIAAFQKDLERKCCPSSDNKSIEMKLISYVGECSEARPLENESNCLKKAAKLPEEARIPS